MELTNDDWLECQRLACTNLSNFVKNAWHIVEPAEPYVHNWHMDALADHFEGVACGDLNRLLINVPPGTSKSTYASVFFPAWLWGAKGKPGQRFIGAAHEQGLATRDNRRTRQLVESDWFQKLWPVEITSDQNEKTYFENTARGFRQSSSVVGITGKRGHVVTWDDPHNPESATSDKQRETTLRIFQETLPLRVVDPRTSAIVIIMQRLHQDDVSGYILENDLGYEHLMLPMEFEPERRCYTVVKPTHFDSPLVEARYDAKTQRWYTDTLRPHPEDVERVAELPVREVYNQDPRENDGDLLFEERFPREVVERDKKVLLAYGTAGQFQQRPAPRKGGIFEVDMIEIIPTAPAGVRWVRGWDLAATDDADAAFTAGALLGVTSAGEYIIGDMKRGQLTPGKVETLIKNTASQDGRKVKGSIPQDPGQSGKAQVAALIRQLAGYSYRSSPESGDKVSRAEPFAAQVEVGNVKMVEGPWNKDLLDEMRLFPASKFKDQVDALSRAFSELVTRKRGAMSTTRH